jgi:hypothetical protein
MQEIIFRRRDTGDETQFCFTLKQELAKKEEARQ